MSTLYISDLDGTLLQPDEKLSAQTESDLRGLIAGGCNFTVATARTISTVAPILASVPLSLPFVLLNGALIYDPVNRVYVRKAVIDGDTVAAVSDIMHSHGVTGFCYTVENDIMLIYYENLDSPHHRAFHDRRVRDYGKKYIKISSFSLLSNSSVVHFMLYDSHKKLFGVYNELRKLSGLHFEYYRDIYGSGLFFLEVCSDGAGKKNALLFLLSYLGCDRAVSFGDNMNDIGMFSVSAESYAVANAAAEIKAAASGVIGANTENGVTAFLKERFG